MSSARLGQRFAQAKQSRRGALLPYLTSGFPDCEATAQIIRGADALGVTAVEIGIPYSDSIADGPVIQSSFNYALDRGHRLEHVFETAAGIRRDVRCGLIVMLSYSLVYRMGVSAFMQSATDAGLDGVIVPDLPVDEAAATRDATRRAGLDYVGLIAPTTTPQRRKEIASSSSGFIYQMAVAGVTGERNQLPRDLADDVAALRGVTGLPICVGFGISSADQVRAVCRIADGAIVGSALVRRIAERVDAGDRRPQIVESAVGFIRELMAGACA